MADYSQQNAKSPVKRRINNQASLSRRQLLLRGRLHGEFQPGLKFRTAHRAEIFLQLQANFSLGAMLEIGRENLHENVLHAFLCTAKVVRMPKFIF